MPDDITGSSASPKGLTLIKWSWPYLMRCLSDAGDIVAMRARNEFVGIEFAYYYGVLWDYPRHDQAWKVNSIHEFDSSMMLTAAIKLIARSERALILSFG